MHSHLGQNTRGGDGSSPQNSVVPTKCGDEAVPAPLLNAPRAGPRCVLCCCHAEGLAVYVAAHKSWALFQCSQNASSHASTCMTARSRGASNLAKPKPANCA